MQSHYRRKRDLKFMAAAPLRRSVAFFQDAIALSPTLL